MMNKNYINTPFLLIISCLLLINCNQSDDPLVYNPELVFPNSFKIKVEPYVYYDSVQQQSFSLLGDSAVVADTVSSTPLFEWTTGLTNLVTVVISKNAFIIEDNNIANANNIIWQWQPGMTDGKNGKVAFFDGETVNNKNILYHTQPLPLESGLYYWAVYGWESSGREIIYSTIPLEIYVK